MSYPTMRATMQTASKVNCVQSGGSAISNSLLLRIIAGMMIKKRHATSNPWGEGIIRVGLSANITHFHTTSGFN
jgi:hypothetical protein